MLGKVCKVHNIGNSNPKTLFGLRNWKPTFWGSYSKTYDLICKSFCSLKVVKFQFLITKIFCTVPTVSNHVTSILQYYDPALTGQCPPNGRLSPTMQSRWRTEGWNQEVSRTRWSVTVSYVVMVIMATSGYLMLIWTFVK